MTLNFADQAAIAVLWNQSGGVGYSPVCSQCIYLGNTTLIWLLCLACRWLGLSCLRCVNVIRELSSA